jgi:transposase InsO family protein
MSQRVLGDIARQEIRDSIIGLRGAELRALIATFSDQYSVSKGYLYAMTSDVRPQRKRRSDSGARLQQWKSDPVVSRAMELVHVYNVKPELAVQQAETEERERGGAGFSFPMCLGHFQRVLRQCGINRRSEQRNATAYRPWQAKFPGEVFQLDFSGLKERWIDRDTRRIMKVSKLEISRNHPNTDPKRQGLWKFTLKDDYSRLQYSRFIACEAPNSNNVLDFLLECFRELGIPLILYADRDSVLRSRRFFRAESILNNAYSDCGGFRLLQHAAGNPRATGKVERAHQVIEEYEKLIGISYEKRTLEELNDFSRQIDLHYNWRVHRRTKRRPAELWQEGAEALRMPPPKLLDSAMKAEEFRCRITDRVTIEFRNEEYQLPRERPFVNWAGSKGRTCLVIWPPEEEYFWLIGPDKSEHEIPRILARVDAAGEFKQPQQSDRQRLSTQLEESNKTRRAKAKAAGAKMPVIGFEVPLSSAAPPLSIPKKKIDRSLEEWAQAGRGIVPTSFVGRPLNLYQAKQWLMSEGLCSTPIGAEDAAWLAELFSTREEILDTELREMMGPTCARVRA